MAKYDFLLIITAEKSFKEFEAKDKNEAEIKAIEMIKKEFKGVIDDECYAIFGEKHG